MGLVLIMVGKVPVLLIRRLQNFPSVCKVCINIIMIHQCGCFPSLPSHLTILQIIKITENERLPVANILISTPITP